MEKLLAAAKAASSNKKDYSDEKVYYYPARDTAGSGTATIRFLPGKTEDDIPFVKVYTHGFKGPTGKWYIEDCPTTIGQDCPCCEQNSKFYATMTKDEARKNGLNRKTAFIANIIVIEDKKNPENEGKLFQYKFGTKVFAKIMDKLQPEDEDDTACNVFDLLEGANFKLKIRKVDGETNYDKSAFEDSSKSPAVDLNAMESLDQYIAPEKFKSRADLEKRLAIALGNTTRVAPVSDYVQEDIPEAEPTKTRETVAPAKPKAAGVDDADDDIMAMMKKLSEEE